MAAKKKVIIHITKNSIAINGSMESTITATILGLAAQIEREFISTSTKEALDRLKSKGIKLGGDPKVNHKLQSLMDLKQKLKTIKGINKRAISKLIECSPSILYLWLRRNKLYVKS